MCPGKSECVPEKQNVSGKDGRYPGKTECVRERQNVSGKDRMNGSSYCMVISYVEFGQLVKCMRKRMTEILFRPLHKLGLPPSPFFTTLIDNEIFPRQPLHRIFT